jgi:hypothetical protein
MPTSLAIRAQQFDTGEMAIGAMYVEAVIWILSTLQHQLHRRRNPALIFMDYDVEAYLASLRVPHGAEYASRLWLHRNNKRAMWFRLETFRDLFAIRAGESNDELDEDMQAISVHDRVLWLRDQIRRL